MATPDHPGDDGIRLPGEESSGGSDYHYNPHEREDALTGRTSLPTVKRFNRKTVGVLLALGAFVTIAALGTALTRQRHGKVVSESAAQGAAAIPTPTDAISTLPSDYGQVVRGNSDPIVGGSGARTGAKMPAEFGSSTSRTEGGLAGPVPGAAPQLTPYEQAVAQ